MDYSIKKTLLHGDVVDYVCPFCGNVLRSPLDDAGKKDACPVCKRTYEVPGIKELKLRQAQDLQGRLAKHKAEDARRQQEESDRIQREQLAERQRLDAIEDEANRRLAAQQADDRERELSYKTLRRTTGADKLLQLAFRVAKSISVIVVIVCVVAILGCVATIIMTQPRVMPPPPKASLPSFDDFRRQLDAESAKNNNQLAEVSTPSAASSERNRHYQVTSLLYTIDQKYGLSRGFCSVLLGQAGVRDESEREKMAAGLRDFLDEVAKYSSANPTAAGGMGYERAAQWYIEQYCRLKEGEQNAAREVTTFNTAERIAADAKRATLTTAIGGEIGVLLAFLLLPLLIQIEHNTRILRFQDKAGK